VRGSVNTRETTTGRSSQTTTQSGSSNGQSRQTTGSGQSGQMGGGKSSQQGGSPPGRQQPIAAGARVLGEALRGLSSFVTEAPSLAMPKDGTGMRCPGLFPDAALP
jgi:hypothetical protein